MDRHHQTTISWASPQGRVRIGITHIKNQARGRDRLQLRVLDNELARLPIGRKRFHDGLYRSADICKAGGPARFAEQLILTAARRIGERTPRVPTAQDTSEPHPLEAELAQSTTYELGWNGPTGPVTLAITHTKTFFNRAHVIGITVPPNTPFPLDTLSYIVTNPDIERAGNAKRFVESLITAAENTARWRDHARRVAQSDLFSAIPPSNPRRPKPKRPRLKLPAPRR